MYIAIDLFIRTSSLLKFLSIYLIMPRIMLQLNLLYTLLALPQRFSRACKFLRNLLITNVARSNNDFLTRAIP